MLCEGWDQPSCKALILARPTKSTGLYLQQAGRILRPWNGVSALILDHAGNCLSHGLPQADRLLTLDVTRKDNGGGAPPTKVCPNCQAIIALGATECPECKQTFERRKTGGLGDATELTEIKPKKPGVLLDIDPSAIVLLDLRLADIRDDVGPRATDAQVATLRDAGIKAQWLCLSRHTASVLIERLIQRRKLGRCTVKQGLQLMRRGLNPHVDFELARAALDALACAGWKQVPDWIRRDPRFHPPQPGAAT